MSRGLPLRAIVSILSYAPNSLPCGVGNSERLLGIGNLNNLFFLFGLKRQPGRGAIVLPVVKIPIVVRPAWGGEVAGGAEGVQDEAQARNQDQPSRRLSVG